MFIELLNVSHKLSMLGYNMWMVVHDSWKQKCPRWGEGVSLKMWQKKPVRLCRRPVATSHHFSKLQMSSTRKTNKVLGHSAIAFLEAAMGQPTSHSSFSKTVIFHYKRFRSSGLKWFFLLEKIISPKTNPY